jgi:hypothetical protein
VLRLGRVITEIVPMPLFRLDPAQVALIQAKLAEQHRAPEQPLTTRSSSLFGNEGTTEIPGYLIRKSWPADFPFANLGISVATEEKMHEIDHDFDFQKKSPGLADAVD